MEYISQLKSIGYFEDKLSAINNLLRPTQMYN